MRKVRPVLGRRAEGLPVRDVGIASLDALDFVPAIAFPGPEGEPEKEKGKGDVRSMHMISSTTRHSHYVQSPMHHLCRVCLINEYYCYLFPFSLRVLPLRMCVWRRESPKTSQVSISASEKALAASARLHPGPAGPGSGRGRPAAAAEAASPYVTESTTGRV